MSVAGNSSTRDPLGPSRSGSTFLPPRLPLIGLIICGLVALPVLLLVRGSLTVAISVPVVFFVVAVFYHRVSSARLLDEARRLRDPDPEGEMQAELERKALGEASASTFSGFLS